MEKIKKYEKAILDIIYAQRPVTFITLEKTKKASTSKQK